MRWRSDSDFYPLPVLRAFRPGRCPEGVSLSRWHREEAHAVAGYLGCSHGTEGVGLRSYPVELDSGRDPQPRRLALRLIRTVLRRGGAPGRQNRRVGWREAAAHIV